jgi:hypothetical protein
MRQRPREGAIVNEGYIIMLLPLLLLVFAWTSVTYWISARATERRMRERYALLKALSERPADSVQMVLEQLRQDDAKEEERQRARIAVMRRGKLEGGFILIVLGITLSVFLYYLAPRLSLWLIGPMPAVIGVVLVISTWLEKPSGER